MKQIFTVNHGTYPFDILVCISAEHKDIVRWVEKRYKMTDEEKERLWMTGTGRTLILENGATILRVDKTKNKSDFHATLAHEIFHCVEFVFDRMGIKHDMKISGEVFAYQIGYITKQIYDKLK